MNHDSSNPFHKLAKDFAAQQEARSGRAAQPRGAAPALSGKVKSAKAEADDDDAAALFLNAVSRIKPLAKKEKKKAGRGESLADRMRSNSAPVQEGSPNAAGRPAPGPVFPDARPAGVRPGETEHAGPGPSSTSRQSPGQHGQPGRTAARGQDAFARQPAKAANYLDGGPDSVPDKRPDKGPDSGPSFASAMCDLFDVPDEEPVNEEEALFAKAMQGVAPVNVRGRDVTVPAGRDRPVPAQDPAKALRDVLEGRVEFALHHTDEFMEGYVLGVDPLVLSRLRAGQYSPEKHMDMHGMNARQAYDALTWFMRDAYQRGLRCVVVVTGRGRNSPDGVGVLRPLLQRWLSREPFKRVVLAFCTARPGDGGPGAVYVLLRKYKKSRGKIIWDHTPSDEDFPDI